MERLCNIIAYKIALELDLDENRKEVISYGMFALLQMIFSILLVIVFGILFGVVIEALIISFTTSILRKYSGGIHASSPGRCAIIGTVSCLGQAMIVKLLINQGISFSLVLILGALDFIWSYYMISKLSPVDTPAKPIKKVEKRKKMRKVSIIILSIYLTLVIVNIVTYNYTKNIMLLNYCLCIFIGISWQVFTITKYGHKLIVIVDTFLLIHLNHRGEAK